MVGRDRWERRSAGNADSTLLHTAHRKAIDFHLMSPFFAPPESPSAGRLLLGRCESDRGLAAALDLDGEPRGNIAFQPTDSSAADPDGRGKPVGLDVVVDGRARKPGAGLYGFAAEYRKGLISHVRIPLLKVMRSGPGRNVILILVITAPENRRSHLRYPAPIATKFPAPFSEQGGAAQAGGHPPEESAPLSRQRGTKLHAS